MVFFLPGGPGDDSVEARFEKDCVTILPPGEKTNITLFSVQSTNFCRSFFSQIFLRFFLIYIFFFLPLAREPSDWVLLCLPCLLFVDKKQNGLTLSTTSTSCGILEFFLGYSITNFLIQFTVHLGYLNNCCNIRATVNPFNTSDDYSRRKKHALNA